MDGVLVDSMPLHFSSWQSLVARHRVAIGRRELRELIDARRNVEIIPILFGRSLHSKDVQALVREKEGGYQRLAAQGMPEVPGARDFLERASRAGVPLALATAAGEGNVRLVLDEMGFRRYFRVVVTARDVVKGKPDPEVYYRAAEGLSLRARDCLVVEDSVLGVRAARASGASCLALRTSHSARVLKEAGANWVGGSFLKLPAVVERRVFGTAPE